MTKLQADLIALKYKGYTYREISKHRGDKPSEGTIKQLFSQNGSLYIPYLQYVAEMDEFKENETKKSFMRDLAIAPTLMRGMLQRALKRHDDRLAFQILKEQMDRAGFVVTRSIAVDAREEAKRKPQTYEEFCDACRVQ